MIQSKDKTLKKTSKDQLTVIYNISCLRFHAALKRPSTIYIVATDEQINI